jgi:1,4-alpha-glucan branching enzyme
MTTSTLNFETATQYLRAVAQPNRMLALDECKELEAYVEELNPSNVHRSSLSEHRKSILERKITELFEAIEQKLHPVHVSPSEIIQKQFIALQAFAKQLPLPPKELQKAIKKLHPDLREKIDHAVWLASGSPQQRYLSIENLTTQPDFLQRKFPAFYAPEGTLLEQISSDLAVEFKRAAYRETIDSLHRMTIGFLSSYCPDEIRKEIDEETLILDQLTQQRDDQKVAIFEERFKETKINRNQMEALFDAMPASVKARLPQPPYFGRGFNPELYKTLGAHYNRKAGITTFCVYAPHAQNILLNLTVWGRIEHVIEMFKRENGIWQAKTKEAPPGRSYHFMIVGKHGGASFKKIDPFAFGNYIHSSDRDRENHESIVRDIDREFPWTDRIWMAGRVNINPAKTPMVIYEVHPLTWKKTENGDPLNWRDLARELKEYCKEMGYTHVELMALFEHPQPISMGYQVTGFFTLKSGMGSIEDFQFFINYLHKENIGVIADWIPAHFAKNEFSLISFDGTPLFEDDNPRYAEHPVWGTYEFDYKKQYTKDFLGSNLDFLLKKFHFDGIRVDAVQSMLNFNRDRIGAKAGDVNEDAKEFISNLNVYAHTKYPGTLMIAEEAMGFPNLVRGVTEIGRNVKTTGVGFDMTWHMGFTNDTIGYLSTPPQYRSSHFSNFIRTIKEVDSSDDFRPRGKVVLPFSHDDNANGRGTILTKMGGNSFPDKFANGRLLLAYQLLRGGGPILEFMGNEILQTQEWHGRLIRGLTDPVARKQPTVQWDELDPRIDIHNHQYHRGARESRKALLHLYHNHRGLQDQTDAGISWIDSKDSENCVLSFHRRGGDEQFACVFNVSDKDLKDYKIPLPDASYAPELDRLIAIREVYNTDDMAFGGQGRMNHQIEIIRDASSNRPAYLKLRLPPFSALLLEEDFK